VCSGGFALDPSLWSPPPSGSTIWTAKLPASVTYFRQLFVNGQRAVMARTPVMVSPDVCVSMLCCCDAHVYCAGIRQRQFDHCVVRGPEYGVCNFCDNSHGSCCPCSYKPGQLPSVHPHNPADTQLVMYESWTASIHQIAAIDDTLHIVELLQPFDAQWAGGASGYRYYAENFLEALDTPGEFYFDRCEAKRCRVWGVGCDFCTCDAVLCQCITPVELHTARGLESAASYGHRASSVWSSAQRSDFPALRSFVSPVCVCRVCGPAVATCHLIRKCRCQSVFKQHQLGMLQYSFFC
jgi:hypothetical protein